MKLSIFQTTKKKFGANGKDPGRWRDLSAYWILGLCNNFGYVVMLSAAHDIINIINKTEDDGDTEDPDSGRLCQITSTGAILLADIIPSLISKALSPFVPFYVNVRVFIACAAQIAGFLLVAFADRAWISYTGVALTSFSSGLGEASFLAYSSKFHKDVISTWSSGTGGAGILGSFSYAALTSVMSPVDTMLTMLCIPFLEGITFWTLLRNPNTIPKQNSEPEINTSPNDPENCVTSESAKLTLNDKIRYIPTLLKFMIPLITVYWFEYFINQGLFELIDFKNIWLTHKEQYRWLNVDYQIGVFISRSSVNLMKINQVWILSVLQLINVGIILSEVLTYFTPSIWIIFAIVLWEGLLGGGAYVNTFYRMSKDIPEDYRNYALGIVWNFNCRCVFDSSTQRHLPLPTRS